jgi:hypothetical protein
VRRKCPKPPGVPGTLQPGQAICLPCSLSILANNRTQTKAKLGVSLEGCLYDKNNQKKTARIIQCPDRFLFLLTS